MAENPSARDKNSEVRGTPLCEAQGHRHVVTKMHTPPTESLVCAAPVPNGGEDCSSLKNANVLRPGRPGGEVHPPALTRHPPRRDIGLVTMHQRF